MRRRPPEQPAQAKPTTRLSDVKPEAAHGRRGTGKRGGRGLRDDGSQERGARRDKSGHEGSPGIALAPPRERTSGRRSAMARAVAMLARREHSQAEILRKLMDKGVPEDEARKTIEELAGLGLQSDQRFLESRVRQRLGGGYGPGRARMDLSGHGLDEAAVDTAMDAPGQAWIQGGYDLIERRFGPSPVPMEVRNKALGMLVRRGFSYDQAQRIVREPRPEPEEGDEPGGVGAA